MKIAIAYLLAITVAELVTNLFDPVVGIIVYIVIFVGVIVHASLVAGKASLTSRLVLSLTLVPLIRILSLALQLVLPMFAPVYWYIIIYPPLMIAAWIAMRRLGYSTSDIGLRWGRPPVQLLVALSGAVLGITEYAILRPAQPMVSQFTIGQMLLTVIALVGGTGLVEEFIFRGVLQKSCQESLGRWGLLYASYLFAILHIIHFSKSNPYTLLDLPFVFAVGMLFGWIVNKTGSLFGVILAHGLTNIMLFLIMPTVF